MPLYLARMVIREDSFGDLVWMPAGMTPDIGFGSLDLRGTGGYDASGWALVSTTKPIGRARLSRLVNDVIELDPDEIPNATKRDRIEKALDTRLRRFDPVRRSLFLVCQQDGDPQDPARFNPLISEKRRRRYSLVLNGELLWQESAPMRQATQTWTDDFQSGSETNLEDRTNWNSGSRAVPAGTNMIPRTLSGGDRGFGVPSLVEGIGEYDSDTDTDDQYSRSTWAVVPSFSARYVGNVVQLDGATYNTYYENRAGRDANHSVYRRSSGTSTLVISTANSDHKIDDGDVVELRYDGSSIESTVKHGTASARTMSNTETSLTGEPRIGIKCLADGVPSEGGSPTGGGFLALCTDWAGGDIANEVTIRFTGHDTASRLRVEAAETVGSVTSGDEIANAAMSTDPYDITHTYEGDIDMDYRVRKASASPRYKPIDGTLTVGSAGVTVNISQVSDE